MGLYNYPDIYNQCFMEGANRAYREHYPDGTVTIHILNAYERDLQIVRQEVFEEHLHPFPMQLVREKLEQLNYRDITVRPCPYFEDMEFEQMGWYCLLAKNYELGGK